MVAAQAEHPPSNLWLTGKFSDSLLLWASSESSWCGMGSYGETAQSHAPLSSLFHQSVCFLCRSVIYEQCLLVFAGDLECVISCWLFCSTVPPVQLLLRQCTVFIEWATVKRPVSDSALVLHSLWVMQFNCYCVWMQIFGIFRTDPEFLVFHQELES